MKNLILILYAAFIMVVVLFSYLFVDVNFFYMRLLYSGFALENRLHVSIGYFIIISIFFLFYLYLLKTIRENGKKYFIAVLSISGLLLLAYPAMLSYDIFNYLITSKVAYFYHENPYVVMPNEFINEKTLIFTRATNKYALYGPVWIGFSAVPYFLGLKNFILTLFLFKIFTAGFYVGSVWLVYKLSKENLLKATFFALNPLVLIEIFVSGHNDIVMIFLALLAFYLVRENTSLSILSFFLSILIKFATIFLVPIYAYTAWNTLHKKKNRWDNVWFWSMISMFVIFILSPIREEMYPWYATWFMPFAALLGRKKINIALVGLSYGLLLYYIPYMFTGQYLGFSLVLKIVCVSVPFVLSLIYILLNKKNLN